MLDRHYPYSDISLCANVWRSERILPVPSGLTCPPNIAYWHHMPAYLNEDICKGPPIYEQLFAQMCASWLGCFCIQGARLHTQCVQEQLLPLQMSIFNELKLEAGLAWHVTFHSQSTCQSVGGHFAWSACHMVIISVLAREPMVRKLN